MSSRRVLVDQSRGPESSKNLSQVFKISRLRNAFTHFFISTPGKGTGANLWRWNLFDVACALTMLVDISVPYTLESEDLCCFLLLRMWQRNIQICECLIRLATSGALQGGCTSSQLCHRLDCFFSGEVALPADSSANSQRPPTLP